MKRGFFLKLAWGNMVKNRRFFLPRILAESGLLACFYIILTLAGDERLRYMRGGSYLPTFMGFGTVVMAILSVILMLYSNSFLIRQRKRELGLYHVLGMEKRHVARVLGMESLIAGACGITAGLLFGVLLYKLCALLICVLLHTEAVWGMYYITAESLPLAAVLFLGVDMLCFIVNRIDIARMKPVQLMVSARTGEREPKTRLPLFLAGLAALGAGYYIALTTESPLKALYMFFAAVLLVIVGTYLLYVSGSIFVLKRLKHHKAYYYHRHHMPVVSGLLFRMKQNAVGLASITILACGILVTISTTVSLYAGMEDSLARNYPYDLYLSGWFDTSDNTSEQFHAEDLSAAVATAADATGITVTSLDEQRFLSVSYLYRDSQLISDRDETSGDICNCIFITADMYALLTGTKVDLKDDEMIACVMSFPVGRDSVLGDTLTLHGKSYRIKEQTTVYPINSQMSAGVSNFGFVVANEAELTRIFDAQTAAYGQYASPYTERIAAHVDHSDVTETPLTAFDDAIFSALKDLAVARGGDGAGYSVDLDTVWQATDNMLGMYGTLLFLGMLLGVVFLFATALIIYYKQISEGYEDRDRFQIMQKIGMSAREVSQTIHAQILLVFFLPPVVAGVHLLVAFPILVKLLKIFMLSSVGLFALCTAAVFLCFIGVYAAIYEATARTYYKIVH